jgi:hypothetical protein
MIEHNAFCNKCNKTTLWRGDEKRTFCQSCNGPFPCYHQCSHVDCKLERKELVVCECGKILEIGQKCNPCFKENPNAYKMVY